jgi:hypothetical protein
LGTQPALSFARSTESDGGVDQKAKNIGMSSAFAHRPASWLLRCAICRHSGRHCSSTNPHCSHLLLALCWLMWRAMSNALGVVLWDGIVCANGRDALVCQRSVCWRLISSAGAPAWPGQLSEATRLQLPHLLGRQVVRTPSSRVVVSQWSTMLVMDGEVHDNVS